MKTLTTLTLGLLATTLAHAAAVPEALKCAGFSNGNDYALNISIVGSQGWRGSLFGDGSYSESLSFDVDQTTRDNALSLCRALIQATVCTKTQNAQVEESITMTDGVHQVYGPSSGGQLVGTLSSVVAETFPNGDRHIAYTTSNGLMHHRLSGKDLNLNFDDYRHCQMQRANLALEAVENILAEKRELERSASRAFTHHHTLYRKIQLKK